MCMKKASALTCAALLLAVLLAPGYLAADRDVGADEAITMDFDASAVGTLPTGFSSAVTGGGGPPSWGSPRIPRHRAAGRCWRKEAPIRRPTAFPYAFMTASRLKTSRCLSPLSRSQGR
jgi:hypothetical protein